MHLEVRRGKCGWLFRRTKHKKVASLGKTGKCFKEEIVTNVKCYQESCKINMNNTDNKLTVARGEKDEGMEKIW